MRFLYKLLFTVALIITLLQTGPMFVWAEMIVMSALLARDAKAPWGAAWFVAGCVSVFSLIVGGGLFWILNGVFDQHLTKAYGVLLVHYLCIVFE